MSDISKEQRYEIVGLTKAEVDRCMEVLCGGPMPWDRGYCFASSELFARPSRYGPEPSNEGRKPMSDESERLQRRVAELERAVEEICRERATPPLTRARLRHALAGVDWRKAK